MLELMERCRMIFDTEERYRLAVKLYAVRHRISTSEVVNRALDGLVSKELKEADKIIANDPKPAPKDNA